MSFGEPLHASTAERVDRGPLAALPEESSLDGSSPSARGIAWRQQPACDFCGCTTRAASAIWGEIFRPSMCLLASFHDVMTADDQFVLSKGHAAGALYIALWTLGRLTDGDLEQFHRDGTRLSGHPPPRGIDEILFATGSLGHGLGLAAGLALGKRLQRRAGPRLLPDFGRRMERGLDLGVADLLPSPAIIEPDGGRRPQRTSRVWDDARSRRPEPPWPTNCGPSVSATLEIDGHDARAIVAALQTRSSDGPAVHRGPDAQGMRRVVHGRPDGMALPSADGRAVCAGRPGSDRVVRNAFCQALVARADRRRFRVLDRRSWVPGAGATRDALGSRFINAGVAEQNMVSVAAGLARQGLSPWVYSIAPFLYARPFEQIRNDVCLHGLPVVFVGNGGGYGYGVMGARTTPSKTTAFFFRSSGLHVHMPAFDADLPDASTDCSRRERPGYLRLGLSEEPQDWSPPAYAAWRKLVAGSGGHVVAVGPLAGSYLAAAGRASRRPPAELVVSVGTAVRRAARGAAGRRASQRHAARGRGACRARGRRTDVDDRRWSTCGCPPRRWFIARRWGYPSGRYGSQKFHRRECRLDAASLLEDLIGSAGTR